MGVKKKAAPVPATIKIRKNDMVKVIAGGDTNKKNPVGRVLEVDRKTGKVLVEGMKMIKRHTRPNPAKQIKGGIAEKESWIHVSNVMVLTPGGVPTRLGYKMDGDTRTRIARKTGEALEKK
jgi:large subunit ribosomal protein L24